MACIAMSQPLGLFESSPSQDGSVLLCDVPFLETGCGDFDFPVSSADVPDDLLACTPVHGWDTPPESPVHSSQVLEGISDPLLNQHVSTVFDPLSTADFSSAVSDMGSVFDWTPPASPIPHEADSLLKQEYLGMPFQMESSTSVPTAAVAAAPAAPVKSNKRKSTSQLSDYERKKAKAKAEADRHARTIACERAVAALSSKMNDEDPESRRHTHNVLERKRRNDLKNSYQLLREQIPSLEENERAPTGQILLHAVEYIQALKTEESDLVKALAAAKARQQQLQQWHGM